MTTTTTLDPNKPGDIIAGDIGAGNTVIVTIRAPQLQRGIPSVKNWTITIGNTHATNALTATVVKKCSYAGGQPFTDSSMGTAIGSIAALTVYGLEIHEASFTEIQFHITPTSASSYNIEVSCN